MEIVIDTDECMSLGLTLVEYATCQALMYHYQNTQHVNRLLSDGLITLDTLRSLTDKGYVVVDDSFKIAVTGLFETTFSTNVKQAFKVFLEAYPSKVHGKDGAIRRLKNDLNKCEALFKKNVGKSKAMLEKALAGLNKEVNERNKSGTMEYMVELQRYLRNKRWEEYGGEGDDERRGDEYNRIYQPGC